MGEYEKQANDFLKKTNTTFKVEFFMHGVHFPDDKETRDIYRIILSRGEREFKFNFGQSIVNSGQWFVFTGHGKILTHGTYNQMQKYRAKGQQVEKNKEFKEPNAYDVLACLTKQDPESFDNFCLEYGYDNDSIKAKDIYKAVQNEYNNLCMLYNESEMDLLREIQ